MAAQRVRRSAMSPTATATAMAKQLAVQRVQRSAMSPTAKADHLAALRVRRAADREKCLAMSPAARVTAKAEHLAARRVRRSATNAPKGVFVRPLNWFSSDDRLVFSLTDSLNTDCWVASGTHGPLDLVPAPGGTPVASSAAAPAANAAGDAQDIGPAPERGLLISEQSMSEILAGRRTLVIHRKYHSLAGQRVYLVEKGTGLVRGTVVMGEPRSLTAAEPAELTLEWQGKPVAWPLLRVTLCDEAWVTTETARTECPPWIHRHRWEQDPSEQPEDLSQLRGGTLVVPI